MVPGDIPSSCAPEDYALGYGDELDIVFLFNPEISRKGIKVRPDGKISYPYVGEVEVDGLTATALDNLLTEKFSEIIREPEISVIVQEFQPQQVYVLGEVMAPGGYDFNRGLTLVQSLTLARGLQKTASKNNVVVVRRTSPDRIVGLEVNIDNILKHNQYELDIPLEPYDIVYVPKSRLASTQQFVESMYSILYKPMDMYLKTWQMLNAKVLFEYYQVMIENR